MPFEMLPKILFLWLPPQLVHYLEVPQLSPRKNMPFDSISGCTNLYVPTVSPLFYLSQCNFI